MFVGDDAHIVPLGDGLFRRWVEWENVIQGCFFVPFNAPGWVREGVAGDAEPVGWMEGGSGLFVGDDAHIVPRWGWVFMGGLNAEARADDLCRGAGHSTGCGGFISLRADVGIGPYIGVEPRTA